MKKFILLLLITIAVSNLTAQNAESPFKFGAKVGVSFSLFTGDIPIELDPLLYTGFTAGIFSNYKFSDKFSIQPEILYSRKGSNFKEFSYSFEEFEIADFNLEMHIQMNWLEVPLLAIYNINEHFTIFAGPYLGIYLDGKLVAESSIAIFGVDVEYDIEEDDLNLPDYGIVLGAAYDINDHFGIQIRWTQGISNISNDITEDVLEDETFTVNNSSFQIQLDITI